VKNMPGFDGRGPNGQDPMSGWGQGYCAEPVDKKDDGSSSPDDLRPVGFWRGLGRRFGFGRGCGRGFGGGRGRSPRVGR